MMGTYNILNALRNSVWKRLPSELYRFIFFSTSEVFGQYSFKSSEDQPTSLLPAGEGRWIYSVSKLASESMLDAFAREVGLSYVIVRPFNIYGVGQVGEGAVHTFINRALNGLPLEIRGDGDQIRSWCYIDDMIEAIKQCTSNPLAVGHTFNIGNPRGTITINMLAYLIKELCQSNSDIVYVPMDYEDVELRIPSIVKAKVLIGYTPKVDIVTGLKKTIDWYRTLQ
jgi:UDP-glucuronate decarboxylase